MFFGTTGEFPRVLKAALVRSTMVRRLCRSGAATWASSSGSSGGIDALFDEAANNGDAT